MTDSRYEKMRHALGCALHNRGWKKPYRNHYAAGGDDVPVWDGLVADGLARRVREGCDLTGGCPLYVVTADGEAAALAGIVFKRRWGYGTPVNA